MESPLARHDRFRVALGAVVFLGAALRLYGLGAESLWVDEVITYRFVTNHGFLELLWVIPSRQPNLPPYYMFLDLWVRVAGTSATALRLPSAVFGVASIPLVAVVGRRLFDRTAGLVAATLFALSPFHLYYAQETRMYSLLALATLCSFAFYLRVRETPTRGNAAGYAVATLATAGVHPFGLLALAAQSLALGYDRWRDGWHGPSSRLERVHAACWGLLTPGLALATLKVDDAVQGFRFISPPGPLDVAGTVRGYFVTTDGTAAALVGLLVLVAVGLAFRERLDREGALLLAWMLVPVVALVVVSYALTPLFWDRYTIAASPAWFLAVGRGVSRLERRHARYALAGLLVVAMVPAVHHHYAAPQKEEWDEATAFVERHVESGDAVVVMDHTGKQAFEYYWDESGVPVSGAHVGTPSSDLRYTNDSELRRMAGGRDRVWLVFTHVWFFPGEKERAIDALDDGRTVVRHREYYGVEVYLLAGGTDGAD